MTSPVALAALALLFACDPPSGEPVPGGTDLTIAEGLSSPYDVVWDGEGYAVVYAHFPPASSESSDAHESDALVFTRLAADGSFLVAPKIVYDLELNLSSLRITRAGSGYVAWYRERGDIFSLTLDAEGEASGSPIFVAPAVAVDPFLAIAGDATGFGILFVSSSSPTDVSFRAVTPEGQPVGAPVVVEERSTEQRGAALALASPGVFTAVWSEDTVLYGATLGADGTVTTPAVPINDANRNYDPVIAPVDESSYVVAARDSGFDTLRLYLVRDGVGVWGEPLVAAPDNRDSRIAYDVFAEVDVATIAYLSDAEFAVAQIVVSSIDLITTEEIDTRTLTNPRYSWGGVALARGEGGFGVVFSGVVEGSERIYFIAVPD